MSFFSPVMPVKMWHRAWALQWSSGGMKQGKLRHGAEPRLHRQRCSASRLLTWRLTDRWLALWAGGWWPGG